ncbi:MAG: rhomboid family intramembrane serine protease [Actinomycetia bacterium]|nr:rhomboid family intramembrane serine protease [Actinomycetes bacterium]MCH9800496.1 rhomboid family intramembrane serine protease [Actinomycetes bacterium]
MSAAPVGFQCPECVREGQQQTRQVVTPMGGEPIRDFYVTKVLIGINVGLFIVEMVAGMDAVIRQWGMYPAAVSLGGEWWRLFTAAFLHGSLLHIGFNMLVLWLVGRPLESILGHVRFVVLYLLAALGGSIASYTFSPLNTLSVGASGAIFGLMAALLVAGHSLKADVTQIAVLLAINIGIGFVVAGIDWRAHLGGAAVGAVVAAIMAYAPKDSQVLWQTLGVLAVCGVLVTMMMVRTSAIQSELLDGRGQVLIGSAEQSQHDSQNYH